MVILKIYWTRNVPHHSFSLNCDFFSIYILFHYFRKKNPAWTQENENGFFPFYFRKSRSHLKFIYLFVANCWNSVTWAIFIALGIFVDNFFQTPLQAVFLWIWQQIFAWLPFQRKFIFEFHKIMYKKNFSICNFSLME